MLLKQSGPPESLLRHMLQSGLSDGLTDGLLQLIVRRIGAKHVKMGEKRMGKKSWLWSIILHVFPDLPTEEQTDMLLEMLGGKVRESFVPDEIADGALKAMPREDVVNDFAALREKLDKSIAEKRFKEEVTRKVGERGEREHATPECIKSLRPIWRQCVLCMDIGKSSFEAYYPGGRPTKSVAMTWSPQRKASTATDSTAAESNSRLAALSYCLEFLWRNHEEKGRVPWVSLSSLLCLFNGTQPDPCHAEMLNLELLSSS